VVIDCNGQLGTVSSSRRFKENIEAMSVACSQLLKLRPVTFRYKEAYTAGNPLTQYGLIAEEVAAVYPELVAYSADGEAEAVQYHKLISMLLNEVQKNRRQIEQQQETIAQLSERPW
jgi:predicted ribosome quality control (RQC) complex YloA/Tae2 family protein